MSHYAIETKGLTKQFGDRQGVAHLNLQIEQGKIYGLLGRNGAGKTTTIRMIMGLIRPTTGQIKIFGQDIHAAWASVYACVGSIIETPGFYENLTGAENLAILARLRKIPRKEMIAEALALVGLHNEPRKIVANYSLGMKQRLGIAAAIMHNPALLILDEPINGLDPIGILEIRKFLARLCRAQGVTILISSHILSEIEQLADTIGVLHEGRLLEEVDMAVMRQRNQRYIEFEVSDPQKAGQLLAERMPISDYELSVQGYVRVHSHFGEQAVLNKLFVEHGLAVSRIQICEENLEDYFLKLIGGGVIG
jgi:bacitracin transport system ATP-binding protein